MKVFLNGSYLDDEEATIAIDDRGFLFGDGLYETVRIFRGGFFRLPEHWQRLSEGARALKIRAPSLGELQKIGGRLVEVNEVMEGTVRVTLTRGRGGEGLRTTGSGPPTLLVTVNSIGEERMAKSAAGLSAVISKARQSTVGLPGSIKSANRLQAILARLEADAAGVDEAILLTADGSVAEGTVSNVFWRSGAGLRTPDTSVGILPGVTRMAVLEICANLGIAVEEGRWPPDEIRNASEVFLTMSSAGPVGLSKLDDRSLSPPPDALFPQIRDAYWALVTQEVERDQRAGPDSHAAVEFA